MGVSRFFSAPFWSIVVWEAWVNRQSKDHFVRVEVGNRPDVDRRVSAPRKRPHKKPAYLRLASRLTQSMKREVKKADKERKLNGFAYKLCDGCSAMRPKHKVTCVLWHRRGTPFNFIGLCDICFGRFDDSRVPLVRDDVIEEIRENRKAAREEKRGGYQPLVREHALDFDVWSEEPFFIEPGEVRRFEPLEFATEEVFWHDKLPVSEHFRACFIATPDVISLLCDCCGEESYTTRGGLCLACSRYAEDAFDGDAPTDREEFLSMLFEMQELEDATAEVAECREDEN